MSKASSPAPAPTTTFSLLTALVAESTEVDFHIRGLVLIQPFNSSSFSAYTTIGTPATYFSATDVSPDLKFLLRRAPTFLKTDRNGNQRIIKAGIYLDSLPADIPRPKLTRVKAAEAKVAAPVMVTSAIATATRGRKPGKKSAWATREKTTKKEKKTRELAPVAPQDTQKPGVSVNGAGGRPKGLEINMMPGAFMPAGERGSRPKKRPARFDGEVEEAAEVKKRKGSACL